MLKLRTDRLWQLSWCSASKGELQAAVQSLRDNFIAYLGPFVIDSGTAVFKISDYLLTADELVELHKAGQLTEEGLKRFARGAIEAETAAHGSC